MTAGADINERESLAGYKYGFSFAASYRTFLELHYHFRKTTTIETINDPIATIANRPVISICDLDHESM